MSYLAPLLEIQEIDRLCDGLQVVRRDLPERGEEAAARKHMAALDEAHQALIAQRAALEAEEHALSDRVATEAKHAKGVEDTLYGGTVSAAKDLSALQDEIAQIRARQTGLEEQEMALLEKIDQVETEMEANRDARGGVEVQLRDIDERLRASEGKIDAALAGHEREKAGRSHGLPEPVLSQYARLRSHDKLNGVAAAQLTTTGCGGCRMQLPRLEMSRMLSEPEDALLCCENCGRLLVR